MALPRIEEYSLSLPWLSVTNRVEWALDTSRSLLLIHDMQQYFLDAMPEKLRAELIANCKALLDRARQFNVPVVYTAQRGDMTQQQRGLLKDFWGSGMTSEPAHTAIVKELTPRPDDSVLAKWRYSAFFDTELEQLLVQEGRDQIVICGVYAHIGVLVTAIDAYSRNVETFLVKDAIADFSEEAHAQALTYAAECCAVVLATESAFK